MDDKPVKRSGGGAAAVAVIVVVFLILPMVYLLAIGPIVWLHSRRQLEVGRNSLVAQAFDPVDWAARACPPFELAMGWYVSLWEPAVLPIQSAPAPVPLPAPAPVPAPPATVPASATTMP